MFANVDNSFSEDHIELAVIANFIGTDMADFRPS